MTQHAWDSAKNILCIRLDYLGDVLMTTPAIRALRQSVPGRRITLLTSPSGAAVARFIPEIDDVLVYTPPWLKSSPVLAPEYQLQTVETLKALDFDAAVLFTAYSQNPLPTAMICHLAHIPLRLAHCHENPYQLLTDWVLDPEPTQGVRHEVQRQLDLVRTIGATTHDQHLSFAVRDEDRRWLRRQLESRASSRPWIMLHPGATAASRRYPAALWAEVLAQLHETLEANLMVTGDANEIELAEAIIAASGVPSTSVRLLAGALDLGQLGAAVELADVVVSNNTGPAHLAAAVGTPVVDLYALTNPQHTPWQVASEVLFHDVPCRFCYKSICPQGHGDCLAKVAPGQVVAAVQRLLARQPATWRMPPLNPPPHERLITAPIAGR
ncbi:ADP-heptose--LPS heptosyltransferase [Novimethylophilus kurashikiensis]|uniref:ADP-heptose--LPS heptosyltransferase n=1 Tax=Novimethylophilus kurashikiensis TaxID=1825523 RepID=A0A2R5F7I8_9PROT|nr:glycosyltransferase family 9 protein [Novimethylophilus kurashikiensis]GBG12604.1 ADP-heptose--LPS heptosyltransferase [Novimethylophilus kurashikiensis]